jgi:ATP-dependent protease HslVU (ClpYQ) peptidase subunit
VSLIVAVKSLEGVYLGADTQVTTGVLKYNDANPLSSKLFKSSNGLIIGSTGSLINHQLLIETPFLKESIAPPSLSPEMVIEKIINPWVESIMALKPDPKNDILSLDAKVLIAYRNDLYLIESSGAIFEISNAISIGSGADFTLPFLRDETLTPSQRVEQSLKFTSMHDPYVSEPFIYMSTLRENI